MGYEVNWHTNKGNPMLQHPLYQKFSNQRFSAISAEQVITAINGALADNESAEIIAYLVWLLRTKALLG